MKSALLLFCLLCSTVICAQHDADGINICITNHPSEGYWIYYGKDRPDTDIPAEGKVEEGTYADGRKEGIWIKYHRDGITPKLKGEYKNNRPSGHYQKFFLNGNLKEEGFFIQNKYSDSLIRYYENGKREYAAFYDSLGKEHGTVRYWLSDGTLELEYEAVHGVPVKKIRHSHEYDLEYDVVYAQPSNNNVKPVRFPGATIGPIICPEKAPVLPSTIITKGVKWNPEGYNKVFNEDDEIWQDGIFQSGKLWDGKVYVYDQDGILLKVKIFKNGLYHSDGQI